ncbi:MAG: VanW family protein [Blastococcus sp.]
MSQHPPAHDETVRFRPDGPSGHPPLDGPRPATENPRPVPEIPRSGMDGSRPSAGEPDDTRPVTRDWLLGAPDSDDVSADDHPTHDDVTDDEASTERIDLSGGVPTSDSQPVADTARIDHQPAPGAADEIADDVDHRADVDGRPDDSAGPPPGEGPPSSSSARPWWRHRAALISAGVLALLGVAYGVDLLIAQGSVPRSTVVVGVEIGGLSPANAASLLEEELAPRVVADHQVVADDVVATFSPVAAGIALDVDRTIDIADDQPLNPWTRLVTLFSDRAVDAVVTGEETALAAQIDTIAAQVDRAPVDATVAIEGTSPSVVPPADGRELDRDGSADAITAALASGRDAETPIELPVEISPVHVDETEAQRVLEETVLPALAAPVAVTSQDGSTSAEVSVAALAASLAFTPQEDGELVVSVDPAALQAALGDELTAFGTPAKDAEFGISGGAVSVVPSVDGTGVDPAKLAEQLLTVLTAPAPRSVTAELGPVPADFTTEEAEKLGIREEISSFTTRFTSAASGTNIRVVAAEVDGALVMPGETFSLNTFTGPRGTAQGYVEAAVIQHGELSKAVGGGISQFATTMFNAVFFAGLEDVFHKPHSFYISRYPAGREATVYEGAIDLQWRNDTDTGVYIDTSWSPGSITVTFYGTKRYEIEALEGARRNHREPAYQEKVDDGKCTAQPGVPGFDVTVTRVFRDLEAGSELRRETFNTSYAAEAIIKCIPPTEPAPPSAPGG